MSKLKPTISCLIPAYNEAKTIRTVIDVCQRAQKLGLLSEIIVVSDGSSDQTAQIAKEAKPDQMVELTKNVGKAGAVLAGVAKAKNSWILLLDGDLVNLQVKHLTDLIAAKQAGNGEMVVGYLADEFRQTVLPHLSGQRLVDRSILLKMARQKKYHRARYNFELLLNKTANKAKIKTLFIPLFGLSHVKKAVKYGFWHTFWHRVKYPFHMLNFYKKILLIAVGLFLILAAYLLFASHSHATNQPYAQMPDPKSSDRILIIVAHPDDETIGPGGFITKAVQAKAQVRVIITTMGDANQFTAQVENKDLLPDSTDYLNEGKQRQQESISALQTLGLKSSNIYFLGFPDRQLKKLLKNNWESPLTSSHTKQNQNTYSNTYDPNVKYTGRNLEDLYEKIETQFQPNIIITHSAKDHNTDHTTVFQLAKLSNQDLIEREVISQPTMYSFLIHWKISDFPRPFRLSPNDPLYPPKELNPQQGWYLLPLTSKIEDQKAAAINDYPSQLKSPYLKSLLNGFIRTNELFYHD